MARRDLRQLGLADSIVRRRGKKSAWLERLDAALDWPALESIIAGIYASREGGLSYPLLTYVKLLLLQQWYGLSDEGLEAAVDDRLSFRPPGSCRAGRGEPGASMRCCRCSTCAGSRPATSRRRSPPCSARRRPTYRPRWSPGSRATGRASTSAGSNATCRPGATSTSGPTASTCRREWSPRPSACW